MNIIKAFTISGLALLLTACGGSAVEGKFKVSGSVMGVSVPMGEAQFSADEVSMGGQTTKIDYWEHKGTSFKAFNKAGSSVIDLTEVEAGKKYTSNAGGMTITLERVDG